jgi:nucleotide-binding universal stress UspA family protein
VDTGPFHRILVAWDGSASAQTALRVAAHLADPRNGHVIALAVLPPNPHAEADDERARERAAHRQRTQADFAESLRQVAGPHARATLHIIEDRHVARALNGYATEHGLDLIVVGRHGQGGPLHPDLGGVARDLARTATAPLLII